MFRLHKRTVDLLLTNCKELNFRDVTMLDFEDSKRFIQKCKDDFKHVRYDLKNNKVCCDNIQEWMQGLSHSCAPDINTVAEFSLHEHFIVDEKCPIVQPFKLTVTSNIVAKYQYSEM